MILNSIEKYVSQGKKLFIVLVDPDKSSLDDVRDLAKRSVEHGVGMFLVGGSLVSSSVCDVVKTLKEASGKPVVLFPGNPSQLSKEADALFLLSLISGRNPDFVIGHHVTAAPAIRKFKLETIPVGYILMEGGKTTSVEYISNTRPIPRDKAEFAVATAMAGEMLGHKLIYLEAGSGAHHPVPPKVIASVKKNISIPLIVGGGLRTAKDVKLAFDAGADIVVVGNVLEKNPAALADIAQAIEKE